MAQDDIILGDCSGTVCGCAEDKFGPNWTRLDWGEMPALGCDGSATQESTLTLLESPTEGTYRIAYCNVGHWRHRNVNRFQRMELRVLIGSGPMPGTVNSLDATTKVHWGAASSDVVDSGSDYLPWNHSTDIASCGSDAPFNTCRQCCCWDGGTLASPNSIPDWWHSCASQFECAGIDIEVTAADETDGSPIQVRFRGGCSEADCERIDDTILKHYFSEGDLDPADSWNPIFAIYRLEL